jgi:hypothetical protein
MMRGSSLRGSSSRTLPVTAALLLFALGEARAESARPDEECPAARDLPTAVEPRLTLAPPALLHDVAPQHFANDGIAGRAKTHDATPHPFGPVTHLSLKVLWLAVHGDGQAGFSTFLGFSSASFGGLRLRF